MLERLESRRLLSATQAPGTNVVEVSGTDAHDFITVTRRRGELLVTLGGQQFTFDASQVELVTIFGGGGSDRILASRGGVRLSVDGEAGDDVIIGGTGDDLIAGGSGNDSIQGNRGNDTLQGGDGGDSSLGGAGNDTLIDESGEDYLAGASGNDYFEDRDGRGVAIGGPGFDSALVFAERFRTVGVESVTFAPGAVNPAAEPMIHLYANRAANGLVTVFVEATHLESGFDTQFGTARRFGTRFEAPVIGLDVAPDPAAPRTPVVQVETQPYELGRLAPGTYTFNVLSRGQVRGTIQIGVTETGLTPETPTAPGPNGPGTVNRAKRAQGTVTGPGGGSGGGGGGGGGSVVGGGFDSQLGSGFDLGPDGENVFRPTGSRPNAGIGSSSRPGVGVSTIPLMFR